MALKEKGSDIDGTFIYRLGSVNAEAVHRFQNELEVPEEVELLIFSDANSMVESTRTDAENSLIDFNQRMVDRQAKVFAPSISEFTNPEERKAIDSVRRDILVILSEMPVEDGKDVWDMMRSVVERQFVHYENSIGGDSEKRGIRVKQVIATALDKIYGGDERRKKLARSVIDARREAFHLPDFAEMKKIFNVT